MIPTADSAGTATVLPGKQGFLAISAAAGTASRSRAKPSTKQFSKQFSLGTKPFWFHDAIVLKPLPEQSHAQGYAEKATGELQMNHSIYSADRSTHLKIVVVALVAGIAVAGFGISARTSSDGSTAQATHVIKAGKPVAITSSDASLVR
jgi:hypothetical protein